MFEAGQAYVLTGPDGTRAVFNAPNDLDFVGYLNADTGINGLLDSADVRESKDNRVEGDGAAQGNNYFGSRVGTIEGELYPNQSIQRVAIAEQKLKRASRALRADATLAWTSSLDGSMRQLSLRRNGKVQVNTRRPKKFIVPMSAALPYEYSQALNQTTILPTGGAGDLGFSSPISSPLTTVFKQQGQTFVVNQGDAETWPVVTINGPITNPTLRNNTTGLQWTLSYGLNAGEALVVDTYARTVLFNGTSSRYGAYAANFTTNSWWPLVAGNNDVRLFAFSYSAGASVTVQWRHAWE